VGTELSKRLLSHFTSLNCASVKLMVIDKYIYIFKSTQEGYMFLCIIDLQRLFTLHHPTVDPNKSHDMTNAVG
jgi:hypothetical protein